MCWFGMKNNCEPVPFGYIEYILIKQPPEECVFKPFRKVRWRPFCHTVKQSSQFTELLTVVSPGNWAAGG